MSKNNNLKVRIKVILFDIGGVIIELDAVPQMLAWTNGVYASEHDFWEAWTMSPNVFAFETGQMDTDTFMTEIVKELRLPISPDEFLAVFKTWSKGVYPGAVEMLSRLSASYQVACLSNTNPVHWGYVEEIFQIEQYFQSIFLSHQIGLHKPRDDVFQHVIQALDCAAEEILFLDDGQFNIDGAQRNGIAAYRVEGAAQAEKKLIELGMLP